MSNTLTISQELSTDSLAIIRQIIEEALRSSSKFQAEEDTLFQIDGAAGFLGVTVDTVRVYVRAGHFKAYKKNKLLYFSKQELMEWIKSEPKKPTVRFRAKARI